VWEKTRYSTTWWRTQVIVTAVLHKQEMVGFYPEDQP